MKKFTLTFSLCLAVCGMLMLSCQKKSLSCEPNDGDGQCQPCGPCEPCGPCQPANGSKPNKNQR